MDHQLLSYGPNAPEAEGPETWGCGLALWRCWLAAGSIGSPCSGADPGTWCRTVQLHNTHCHVPRAALSRSCSSGARQPGVNTAFSGLHCTQHTVVCSWKSWPGLCVRETPPILGSSWRTELKILKLRQLLWLGPIYELPVEACCFQGRANTNWFRKSQGQGVNIIFQSAVCCVCRFCSWGRNEG